MGERETGGLVCVGGVRGWLASTYGGAGALGHSRCSEYKEQPCYPSTSPSLPLTCSLSLWVGCSCFQTPVCRIHTCSLYTCKALGVHLEVDTETCDEDEASA